MTELTMSEALKDPLIRLVLRADKVSMGEFAQILQTAASRRNRELADTLRGNSAHVRPPLSCAPTGA